MQTINIVPPIPPNQLRSIVDSLPRIYQKDYHKLFFITQVGIGPTAEGIISIENRHAKGFAKVLQKHIDEVLPNHTLTIT
jgi:hypothetical protein